MGGNRGSRETGRAEPGKQTDKQNRGIAPFIDAVPRFVAERAFRPA